MKASKLLLPLILILALVLGSCTKQSETDKDKLSEKKDSATQKLDLAVETVFAGANPVAPADTSIAPVEFRGKLNEVLLDYIGMKQALSTDDSTKALMKANQIKRSLTNVKADVLTENMKEKWNKQSEKIEKCCKDVTLNENIVSQRKAFAKLTDIMTEITKEFGFRGRTIYLMHCADKNAGYWIVDTKDSDNPYLGKTHEGEKPCAEVKEAWKFE
jgi:hypothetical protein